jgi:hypothetical protein
LRYGDARRGDVAAAAAVVAASMLRTRCMRKERGTRQRDTARDA